MERLFTEFHKNCGEILRLSVYLDQQLDFFIANYFVHPQTQKTFLFQDEILIKRLSSLDVKKQIFQKICETEGEDCKDIIKSIEFVQKIRNEVAHGESFVDGSDASAIKLQKRVSTKYKKDEIKPTQALVEQVKQNTFLATNKMTDLYLKFSNNKESTFQ